MKQYRAYSFGKTINFLAIFGLVYRRGLVFKESNPTSSQLFRSNRLYIVITAAISRCERITGARNSRSSSQHVADFFSFVYLSSIFCLPDEGRSEASAFLPLSTNPFAIERERTRIVIQSMCQSKFLLYIRWSEVD